MDGRKKESEQRKHLILDNFSVHEQYKKQLEYDSQTKVVFLPANSMRLIQPLDLTVNNQFKKKLREIWIEKHDNSRVKLSRKEVANRVAEAWGSISAQYVKLGFSKAKLYKNKKLMKYSLLLKNFPIKKLIKNKSCDIMYF